MTLFFALIAFCVGWIMGSAWGAWLGAQRR